MIALYGRGELNNRAALMNAIKNIQKMNTFIILFVNSFCI